MAYFWTVLRGLLFVFLALYFTLSFAQYSINSAGGFRPSTPNAGEITYSLGQLFIQNNVDAPIIVQEGVHHPFENFIAAETISFFANSRIDVYPNPTYGPITIVTDNLKNISLEVFDQHGKRLLSESIKNEKVDINLEKFSGSIYFLRLLKANNDLIHSTKIFKY